MKHFIFFIILISFSGCNFEDDTATRTSTSETPGSLFEYWYIAYDTESKSGQPISVMEALNFSNANFVDEEGNSKFYTINKSQTYDAAGKKMVYTTSLVEESAAAANVYRFVSSDAGFTGELVDSVSGKIYGYFSIEAKDRMTFCFDLEDELSCDKYLLGSVPQ